MQTLPTEVQTANQWSRIYSKGDAGASPAPQVKSGHLLRALPALLWENWEKTGVPMSLSPAVWVAWLSPNWSGEQVSFQTFLLADIPTHFLWF